MNTEKIMDYLESVLECETRKKSLEGILNEFNDNLDRNADRLMILSNNLNNSMSTTQKGLELPTVKYFFETQNIKEISSKLYNNSITEFGSRRYEGKEGGFYKADELKKKCDGIIKNIIIDYVSKYCFRAKNYYDAYDGLAFVDEDAPQYWNKEFIRPQKIDFITKDICRKYGVWMGFRRWMFNKEETQTVWYPVMKKHLKEINDCREKAYEFYSEYKDIFENEFKQLKEINIVKETQLPVIKEMIEKESQLLKQLYEMDVIHPKYRNIIAISSFIDYFSTGRCDSLDGAEGAYNIFENEIRLDKIISQFDQAIKVLNSIKETQYALYISVSEINENVKNLSDNFTNYQKEVDDHFKHVEDNFSKNYFAQITNNILTKESLEIQQGILKHQEFQELIYSDPSAFGRKLKTGGKFTQ